MDKQSRIPVGIYQHFKGNRYEVLGTAKHSETEEEYVIYKTLYGDYSHWIKPLAMFTETIERDGKKIKRFEFIKTRVLIRTDTI